jgi:hypothetical protein
MTPDDVRTFAMWLRDHVPLPHDTVARLIALDAGRHPTLTEMRFALGLDLDLEEAGLAGLRACGALDPVPSDADLAAVLDAMYRGIASTRLVRAECGDVGPALSRAHEPIVIREG